MKSVKMGLAPKLVAVAFLIVAGVALAAPNHPNASGSPTPPSASGVSFSNINLTTDACAGVSGTLQITATGVTDDGGGNDVIWFTIFDDGIEKFAQQISIPVGTTTTTTVTVSYPGTIGGSAPGIGLEVGELRDDLELANIDPFFPTAIGGACAVVPTTSNWTLSLMAAMLALLGLGVLVRRKQA